MCQIALAESHKETYALYAWNVLGKRLNLLVVKQIHILHTHLLEVVFTLDLHRFGLYPMTVLPI